MITLSEALCRARNELSNCRYNAELAVNPGLRSIYEDRSEWLSQLIHAASQYQKIMENSKYG